MVNQEKPSLDGNHGQTEAAIDDTEIHESEIEELGRKNLHISENQARISKYSLISSTFTSVSLVLLTSVLAYFTNQLRNASLSQVRSYLSIQSVKGEFQTDRNVFSLEITLKSDGYTPSLRVFTRIAQILVPVEGRSFENYGITDNSCKAAKNELFEDIAVGEARHYKNEGLYLALATKYPNKDLLHFVKIPNNQQINEFKTNKSILLLKGVLCYNDIFGDSHYLRFCRGYDFENISSGKDAHFSLCAQNDSN